MNNRLSQLIDYATKGKQAEFARLMGWKPQYLHNMLKGQSFALQPVLTILTKFPELDARWFLLGEGEMIAHDSNSLQGVEIQLRELAEQVHKMRETKSVKQ